MYPGLLDELAGFMILPLLSVNVGISIEFCLIFWISFRTPSAGEVIAEYEENEVLNWLRLLL